MLVRTVDTLPEQPEGNDFPDRAELRALMDGARLGVAHEAALDDFPEPEPAWRERVDAVDRAIEAAHQDDERFRSALQQQRMIGCSEQGLVQGLLRWPTPADRRTPCPVVRGA